MKRKISISTALTLILLAIALTVYVTMLVAMRRFNNQLQLVGERQVMYQHINDIDKVVREYYPNLDKELLRQSIAKGYIGGLNDAYVAYYTPQEYVTEQLNRTGRANNIGVELGLNSESLVMVNYVHTESAAEKAGVKIGDVVTAIDGVPVEGKGLVELQSQINAATKVGLTVRRGEGIHVYEVSAYEYAVRSVRDMTLGTVGYVRITAFNDNTPDQFKAIVSALLEQGVAGIVFDVRNNAGGQPAAVQEMLSYIMPLGAYGTMTDTQGNVTKLTTKMSNQLDIPTVTLINNRTMGEAEFFAGALQEAGLTTVMGQTSKGKAKFQDYFVLEQDYSALKLTVGEYGLMKAGSWQGVGITPDEEVLLSAEQELVYQWLAPQEDAQVQAAVTKLTISAELPQGGAAEPDTSTTTTGKGESTTEGETTTTTAENDSKDDTDE